MSYNLNLIASANTQRELAAAWHGACRITAASEPLFPLSTVQWEVDTPASSRVVLDATLLNSPRLPFYAVRLASVLPVLEAAHSAGPLPSCSIPINLDDGSVTRGIAFCSSHPDDLLVPDPVFIGRAGYQQVRDYWADVPVPWHRRLPVVFWRGGTSGHQPDGNWRKLPRLLLCEQVQTLPLFDVGISHFAQLPEGAEDEITKRGLRRAFIGEGSFNFYRYHIDIDGNSNSWPGFFIKLLSGGATLKVTSPLGYRQWYYERLAPWEHYVPVEADMSDLIEKADWLVANDAKAIAIGAAGRNLAEGMTLDAEVALAGQRVAAAAVLRAGT